MCLYFRRVHHSSVVHTHLSSCVIKLRFLRVMFFCVLWNTCRMTHMLTYHELVHRYLCHLVETSLFSFYSASLDICCVVSHVNKVCSVWDISFILLTVQKSSFKTYCISAEELNFKCFSAIGNFCLFNVLSVTYFCRCLVIYELLHGHPHMMHYALLSWLFACS